MLHRTVHGRDARPVRDVMHRDPHRMSNCLSYQRSGSDNGATASKISGRMPRCRACSDLGMGESVQFLGADCDIRQICRAEEPNGAGERKEATGMCLRSITDSSFSCPSISGASLQYLGIAVMLIVSRSNR